MPDTPEVTTEELAEQLGGIAQAFDAQRRPGAASQCREAAARLRTLEAENKRLREALKPFAQAAKDCLNDEDANEHDCWEHSIAMHVTIGSFRNARAALKGAVGGLWQHYAGDVRASFTALARTHALVPREASDATLAEGAAKGRDFFSLRSPYPRARAVYNAMLSASDLLASMREGG